MSGCGRRKKKVEASMDVAKLKAEREKFYKDLEEIEKLKDRYFNSDAVNEEINVQDEVVAEDIIETVVAVSKTSSITEVHPGRETFIKDKKYQCFTKDSLMVRNVNLPINREMLELRIMPLKTLGKSETKQLFYLMSLDENDTVSDMCLRYLIFHIDHWVPKMKHIVKVFMNWGATYESLGITNFEASIIFPKNSPILNANYKDGLPNFCYYNYEYVLSYIKMIIRRYSDHEILILLKILVRISLDKNAPKIFDTMKKVKIITVCVEAIQNWDNFKVVSVTKYIHIENEHFHNQIVIATTVLSKISRCNDLKSCLSFAILHSMINSETKFDFPYEDEALVALVQRIKITDRISNRDIYELYLIVYLVNNIVFARNMVEHNFEMVEKIQICLEALKTKIMRRHNTVDANLLQGRIYFCGTMWNLFSAKEED